jgi:hypothetical protein
LTQADIFGSLANIHADDFSGEHLLRACGEAKKRAVEGMLAQQLTDNRSVKNLRLP